MYFHVNNYHYIPSVRSYAIFLIESIASAGIWRMFEPAITRLVVVFWYGCRVGGSTVFFDVAVEGHWDVDFLPRFRCPDPHHLRLLVRISIWCLLPRCWPLLSICCWLGWCRVCCWWRGNRWRNIRWNIRSWHQQRFAWNCNKNYDTWTLRNTQSKFTMHDRWQML